MSISPTQEKKSVLPQTSVQSLPNFVLVLSGIALFTLYFLGLGNYPLLDPDEPVYGQVGREMASGAGWLSPHFNGGLWFDKPPLFYWLEGLSISLFGANEFACRLPSALAGVALVALVYRWASHDFGRGAGLMSAVVLATCLQQIILARASVTDMTFVLCLTAALYGYRRWLDALPGQQLMWALVCGVFTGLAMLTKGPVAPLLLLLTFLLHLGWIRQLKRLKSMSALVAFIAVLVVGLPWYVAMYLLHGQEFVEGFLVANNLTRFLKAEHANQTGHWYSVFINFPILLLFFFPWSLFLIQATLRAWKLYGGFGKPVEITDTAQVGARLALVWFALVFVFFSLSKTILITYIFPIYPAVAMLVGILWSEVGRSDSARRGVKYGLEAAIGLSVLLTIGLVISTRKKDFGIHTEIIVAGAILMVTCIVAFLLSFRSRSTQATEFLYGATLPKPMLAISAGMSTLTAWLVLFVMPTIGIQQSTRTLVAQLPNQPASIASHKLKLPSTLFYLKQHPQDRYLGLLEKEQAQRELANPTPFFLVCGESYTKYFMAPGISEWARDGGMVVLGNAAAMKLPRQK